MSAKHTHVFTDIGHATRPMGVYIARIGQGNCLEERVSEIVIAGFAGNIKQAVAAFDEGNPEEGKRLLFNLP